MSSALGRARDGTVGYWDGLPSRESRVEGRSSWQAVRGLDITPRRAVMDQAIQSLFAVEFQSSGAANDTGMVSFQNQPLVTLHRPGLELVKTTQLPHLRAAADLRFDRLTEIRVETSNIQSFFAGVSYMSSGATKWTMALLQAVFRLCTRIEMPVKLGFDLPRPITLAYEVQPIIQTPGHGAWPSGHATESFAGATLLSRLFYDHAEGAAFDPGAALQQQNQLYRHAERIAINRTVAGVHYPTDSMAGAVLGVTMAEALVNLLDGKTETTARVYRGDLYEGDFNLSLLSAELAAQDKITESTVQIDSSVVPEWLKDMWAEAQTEA
ncbi:PAP2 superfamily protein [Salipiger abyssi]|uniref:PAP2 superfamily protein n=1 Tax=Salipiger abyssi TaxID=1250539 RepID=A0A1P8V045_9RHOB|nr:PAP2 superfamily protein [Salipiger abyssi]